MGVPGNADLLLLKTAVAGGYQVSRSLRFNGNVDSTYLNRTPASTGNRKTFTFSFWLKRTRLSDTYDTVLHAPSGSAYSVFAFYQDSLYLQQWNGGGTDWVFVSSAVYRDPSAWYHFVFAFDTTQATNTDRVKIYVNGQQVTTFSTATYPSQNVDTYFNLNVAHYLGQWFTNGHYLDAYLAECHLIDGQQLTPSSFGETDATTGQWIPKLYSGSYGTNGFKLTFADNSAATATTLGKDTANSNNWTPNNFSVTAGAGNDSLVDSVTSYGTDTGAGGEVRGNYCTLNPLTSGFGGTLTNGNLDWSIGAATRRAEGTIAVTSGKWFWEGLAVSGMTNGTVGGRFGLCVTSSKADPENITFNLSWHANSGLRTYINGSDTQRASGTNYNDGDLLACALDADSNIAYFYKNGTLAYTYDFSSFVAAGSAPLTPHVWNASSGTPVWTFNFGQRAWAYTARTSHKALVDTNLTAPVIAKPNTAFDVKLWTGNGGTQTISGLNFSPDFVFLKCRSNTRISRLVDTVRGATKILFSSLTNAEETDANSLTAFNSDGFTLGSSVDVNESSQTFVGWVWDAGTSTVTNTQGSITSQVRANASAGFSIVTYTTTGSASTVGHGLGVAPSLIITKQRNGTTAWYSYHASIGANNYLLLNSTAASAASSGIWNNTAPTSTVFTVGSGFGNGETYVAYAFSPVAGYSSFGSYTGNGSSDGPFVYTGFRPRWVMFKVSSTTENWYIIDSSRNVYNVAGNQLKANTSDAEDSFSIVDFTSTGFKIRNTFASYNSNGATYIYAAFAENPFQYARAR